MTPEVIAREYVSQLPHKCSGGVSFTVAHTNKEMFMLVRTKPLTQMNNFVYNNHRPLSGP